VLRPTQKGKTTPKGDVIRPTWGRGAGASPSAEKKKRKRNPKKGRDAGPVWTVAEERRKHGDCSCCWSRGRGGGKDKNRLRGGQKKKKGKGGRREGESFDSGDG